MSKEIFMYLDKSKINRGEFTVPLSLVLQIDGQMISLCLLVLQIPITCCVLFWAMHLKSVFNLPCTQGYSWFSGRVYGFTVEPINGRHAYIPFHVSFFLVGNFLSSSLMSSCLCELYVCVCGFANVYTLCLPFVWDYASSYIIHVHNDQLNKCPFIQPLNI